MHITSALLIAVVVLIASSGFAADEPTTQPVTFEIDAAQTYEISPLIYGANFPNWDAMSGKITFTRLGGNRMTAYNWETNASNAGADWHHQNDGHMGASNEPGDTVRRFLDGVQGNNAAAVVTVPCAGYVSADKKGDGDVNKTLGYITKRFDVSLPRKGEPFAFPPDITDRKVYQDEFVDWVEKTYPQNRKDPSRQIIYALDNEPDIWHGTHNRIRPKKLTYKELIEINTAYASAIKDVAPEAQVFGFCSYGWNGWHTLQDAPDADGRDFFEFYCQEMRKAEEKAGKRLIDAIDIHYYPEARGGGIRITEDKKNDKLYAARIQAPRSLWDPTYTEKSWITDKTKKPMAELRVLKETIDKNYPGTKLAICEYDFGGGEHVSGALAQADALGIFGREGIYAASIWRNVKAGDFIYGAFLAFRDFDGKGGKFGSTGLAVTSEFDPAIASLYASRNEKGDVIVVGVNKFNGVLPATLQIRDDNKPRTVTVYQITSGQTVPKEMMKDQATSGPLSIELPPLSVTTIVLASDE